MQTNIPEHLDEIANKTQEGDQVSVRSLAVMTIWCAHPARLSAFAIFVARQVSADNTLMNARTADFFVEVQALLTKQLEYWPEPSREVVEGLHQELRAFQPDYWYWRWVPVRTVEHPPLILIEECLEVYLNPCSFTYRGPQLALHYCQGYIPKPPWPDRLRRDTFLASSSHPKIQEIADFMRRVERWEDFVF